MVIICLGARLVIGERAATTMVKTVKIFNMRGRPIDAVRQVGSNEVKWHNPDVHAGSYIYLLEAQLEDGKRKQVKNVMEVLE